jgi:hypothetical protein
MSTKIAQNQPIFPTFSSRKRPGIRIPTNNRRSRRGSRVVRGGILLDVLREFGYLIYDRLDDVTAEPGFSAGFWLGVAALAVGMFLIFRLRVWWGDVTAPFRPQRVTHTTSRTPAEVAGNSCRSLVLGIVVIVVIVFILVAVFFPDVLEAVGLRI